MEGRKKIYLAGTINSNPKTYEWREEAKEALGRHYKILDPTNNRFNKKAIKEHKGDPKEFTQHCIDDSQGILIVKDFNLVKQSDILLVNLNYVIAEKPSIGTMFELAWAWLLKIPVIAIAGDDLYSKHPFVAGGAVSAWAKDLEEACKIIEDFFVD